MSFLGSIISGIAGRSRKLGDLPSTPDYYEDPSFRSTQDYLQKYAETGLQGDLPDWYKQIGEAAPDGQLSGLIGGLTSDIISKASERDALRGTGRGGALSSDVMQALGNQSAQLRYNDWLRAMEGRLNIFNTLLGTEEGVRGAGFENMAAKNNYQQWKYNTELDKEIMMQNRRDLRRKETGQIISRADAELEDAMMNVVLPGSGFLKSASGGFTQAPMAYTPPTSIPSQGTFGAIGGGTSGVNIDSIKKLLQLLS